MIKHKRTRAFIKVQYKIAHKTNNTIRKHINLNNDYNKTGVYKLKFSDCNNFYTGQTHRSLTARYEHIKAINQKDIKSNFTDSTQINRHINLSTNTTQDT